MSIKRSTLKKLWAASGNQCGYPGCDETVVNIEEGIVVAEICHIRAQSSGGPRYDPDMNEEEVDEYSNLILLCPTHHTYIDKNPGEYPPEKLKRWKEEQESESSPELELPDNLLDKLQWADARLEGEIFSQDQEGDFREYLQKNTDHSQRLPYVERQEVPDELDQKHLIVGPKGSGKSRVLFERALSRFETGDVQSVFLPSRAATRIEDIQPALDYEYDGDVLLVWDDIHDASPDDAGNLFYETVLKLQDRLSDHQSLHVLATARSEEYHQLPNYRQWSEDRVWSSFKQTKLGILNRSDAEKLIKEAISGYDLTFTDSARRQFETLVEFESPTPFYIESACSHLEKVVDGEITRGDIIDLPKHGVEIWRQHYRDLIDKDPDARFVLLSLKLLNRISGVAGNSVVRGIFANVFNRELINFEGALRRLQEQHWISEVGIESELRTHAIQLEAIDDSVDLYLDQLAEFLLSDFAESEPDQATGMAINLALEVFLDPSLTDESLIDEIAENILSSELVERVSPEIKWMLYNNYAGVLAARGELVRALSWTTRAIQMLPTNPVGYVNHQKIASQLGEETVAINSQQRAVELAPDADQLTQPELRAQLAECLHRHGHTDRAKEEFQTALENSGDDPFIAQRFAEFCEDINQIGTARSLHSLAVEQTDSISTLLQYTRFLQRHGPEETYKEMKEQILQATPENIATLSDAFEQTQKYKLQWTEEGHNSPLITDLPEYQMLEQARDLNIAEGPAEAAAWLESQITEPALPVLEQLVEFYFDAGQPEDAYRVFDKFLPIVAEQCPPLKVSELTIDVAHELDAADAGEKAIEIAESAVDQFATENEENRQAQSMLLRHMAGLDNYDPMHSLILPYRLGKSHLFHGDFENALNTFFDVWTVRNDVPDEEADVGMEYGVKAGCISLALVEIMRGWGGRLTGDSFPVEEINQFVLENISIVSDEFQQLYAEIQIHRGEGDPLCEKDELPEPERIYPDQVDIDESAVEYPMIEREDIAITSTLRAYLQMDPKDIF
ncbi:HNH endonuclease [Halogeometricum borinquense]|uniref:HNH endonuclease n=1 Tax=Halogeometricum borinquense TaxID=60847 RepID=A0A6C0UHJ1_9EURY|nr:HNH endonuclease signature motif containing protein [Halogeometricum borinquense]QIB74976.1 HNH endonuclease [Halogeometricum borinquense]